METVMTEDMSISAEELSHRFHSALYKRGVLAMGRQYVENLIDPQKPYTPLAHSPDVQELVGDVNRESSLADKQAALARLDEAISKAAEEYRKVMEEAANFGPH